MNHSDLVNGAFEFLGGCAMWANCWRLGVDKQVRGFSVWSIIFFTSWGLWNCVFYPLNGLLWSFAGGLWMVLANTVWVSMAVYFAIHPRLFTK